MDSRILVPLDDIRDDPESIVARLLDVAGVDDQSVQQDQEDEDDGPTVPLSGQDATAGVEDDQGDTAVWEPGNHDG